MHSPIIQARKNSNVWKITAIEKRPSINKILSFFVTFNHPLSPCCSSLVLRIASKCHFFTPLPPLQRRGCLWIVPKIFAHLERVRSSSLHLDGMERSSYQFHIRDDQDNHHHYHIDLQLLHRDLNLCNSPNIPSMSHHIQ